ncbi:MAG: mismatch repair protein MutS [Petrotoga sp.]|jgi:DNA mismatch repair ATPase MutS|nr:mismatch repair protein MutS [Petrotoga sp.]
MVDIIDMNNVEDKIINLVSKFYPEPFEPLNSLYEWYYNFIDPVIENFFIEIQFFTSYIDLINKLKERKELNFCFPKISNEKGQIYIFDSFALVFACTNLNFIRDIIPNDFTLNKEENAVIVTGPNQS